MSASASLQPTTFSPDVAIFAAEHDVTDYLSPVLDMTRQVFPNASVTPRVQEDAEVPEVRFLLVEVDTADLNADQLLAAEHQWSAGLFVHCPSTHAHLFCLGTV
jgi:hypothetical protein